MDNLEKSLMKTPDLNKERLEKLKELFPDIFTAEGTLNLDELKKIVDPDLIKDSERFEFKWFGKSEAKRTAFTPSKATLVYDEARSVNPDDADGNMIIEGENLESLKCLLSAYRERVKCIYIDPPYNTGKDFVYSDNWDETRKDYWEHIGVTSDGIKLDTNSEASGRFHSNWLNMMYPRLLIARQFLKDEGVIFISIDDNEIHNLRKLCDEVFGEENFVGIFPWRSRTAKADVPFGVSVDVEWVVAYAKPLFIAGRSGERKYFKSEDYEDRWRLQDLTKNTTKDERPNSYFTMINPRNGDKYPASETRTWSVTKDTFPEYYDAGKIVFPGDYDFLNIKRPAFRVFEQEDKQKTLEKYGVEDVKMSISTYLPEKEVGRTEHGSKEIRELFGRQVFSYPKPSKLIKFFIENLSDPDAIVMDFFAGSGTTAQAVMELNAEDGGNRKFILNQLPEILDASNIDQKLAHDYCIENNLKPLISEITIERNKRVIQKLENEPADLKTGFKVYKLAKSNFPRVDFTPVPDKTEEENIELLKKYIAEKERMFLSLTETERKNIFDEVLLKNGFMLNYNLKALNEFKDNKVFNTKDKYKECLICLDASIKEDTLKCLEAYKDKLFICLEQSLTTTMKWNLKHLLGDKLMAL